MHGTQVLDQYNHSLMQAFILKNIFFPVAYYSDKVKRCASAAAERRNKGTVKQLVEIAETVVFQEWRELKDNQRLDFFVLLYQDKRTRKIRSDFYRTKE